MKHLILAMVLMSFSVAVMAEESETECAMMKEANERSNPKAGLADKKPDEVKIKSSTAQ